MGANATQAQKQADLIFDNFDADGNKKMDFEEMKQLL